MLTQQRARRVVESHVPPPSVVAPCVAVHTEDSQVPRFVARAAALQLSPHGDDGGGADDVDVVAIAPPLVYVQARPSSGDAPAHAIARNAALRREAARAFGNGRIAAHRVYQLDWSCSDPQWIPFSQAIRDASSSASSVTIRVTAFPRQLQATMAELLAASGLATHPTQFTHELFVTAQPAASSLFFFGLVERGDTELPTPPSEARSPPVEPTPSTRAEAPCRAFFKLEESLAHHVELARGAHALDVGASPGGWTDCLLRHGARVVAVDPGELTIPLAGRAVVHIQSRLEDAFGRLLRMDKFALAVCDINVRVAQMAALMLGVAPLLLPGARVVFTLKLGKKPTPRAVDGAFAEVCRILSPAFAHFQLVWLHANTQNERTLFAVKRRDIAT